MPRLCDLKFESFGKAIYLLNCGIQKIDLAEKSGAYIAFTYEIMGGAWSAAQKLTS